MLKSTYDVLKRQNQKRKIRENAIDFVNNIEKESKRSGVDRWQYATWKIKSNLIHEMCTGWSGIGGFSDENKENAIMTVLNSCRHDYEFDKILTNLKDGFNINIDSELDFSQQGQFNALKAKFNYQ